MRFAPCFPHDFIRRTQVLPRVRSRMSKLIDVSGKGLDRCLFLASISIPAAKHPYPWGDGIVIEPSVSIVMRVVANVPCRAYATGLRTSGG